jgi:hypothetical protein
MGVRSASKHESYSTLIFLKALSPQARRARRARHFRHGHIAYFLKDEL